MNRLDAVAVREANGVDICNDYYSTKATHVMDPVFLLTQDDYKELADKVINYCMESQNFPYEKISYDNFYINYDYENFSFN